MSLHTSFLRVIMHHGALLAGSTADLPLVNSTTDSTTDTPYTPCSPAVNAMRVPEANAPETQPEIDLIHHQNRSSHKALETLPMATTRPSHTQVNLPFSYHYHYRRSKGTSLPRCWRRGATVRHARDTSLTRKLEKAQVVPPFHTPTTTSTRKDDKPTVCYRRQWNPCHMDFGLVPASH